MADLSSLCKGPSGIHGMFFVCCKELESSAIIIWSYVVVVKITASKIRIFVQHLCSVWE
jgi:hypothetical protein